MSYPCALVLAPRVRVVVFFLFRFFVFFSVVLAEEDVSPLQHGTVFIVSKTGFMTNSVEEVAGMRLRLRPPRPLPQSLDVIKS